MKKTNVVATICVALMGMTVVSCGQKVNTNVSLKTSIDSVCYAIGVNYGNGLGTSLKAETFSGGPANMDAFIAGFLTAVKGDTAALKMEVGSVQAFIQQYFMAEQAKASEALKTEGQAFLNANKSKEGVITTESGLQYKVITEGSGAKPTTADKVKVHYTGKLLDGTVFDSSVERGEPVTFNVTGVIPGWTEVLQIMPVGSKYQVWIPSELGYGQQGAGQMIKPNSTLEFEVELLEIVKE
ncbi:MAG: FKBP-type peptidyl-prolyl cis-trans isomerase [Tannerella sp.]|jgi:FKBP-type peptidyl-prolyl cis-trans isomerase|nr:FKBP-type peptidyl-prolyl cis-trans isomerase [Tannerella sp.]